MSTRMGVLVAVVICAVVGTGPAAGETWDHIHLTVSDTAAAAAWYAKHFGGEVTKSGPFDAVLFGSNLMKFRGGGDDVLGSMESAVDHVAFSVEDVDATVKALREDGVEVGKPNRKTKVVALATDPWGTRIELLNDDDLRGFHHVHLKSTTPRATVEWYTTMFGGEAENFKGAAGINAIRYNDMYLFIQTAVREVASTKGRSVDHLGWRFKDFDAIVKRMKDAGVKFIVEPTQSGDHMIAFVEGPDGVKIEIVQATGG